MTIHDLRNGPGEIAKKLKVLFQEEKIIKRPSWGEINFNGVFPGREINSFSILINGRSLIRASSQFGLTNR